MVTRRTEHRALRLLDESVYEWDERRFSRIVCELDGYPDWRILPEFDITETGLRLRRLVIEPSEPGVPASGITTRMLRQLRTGDLLAALRAATRQVVALTGAPDLDVSHRAGRRGRDDLYYARWAAEYADALTRSGNPVAEMAGRHHLSASQVRNLVHACRKRKMLTAAPPGRAGGELTARAIELLREH
jgi:hypothetical protein